MSAELKRSGRGEPLAPEQQNRIDQVAATMAIEDMPLTERCRENLRAMAAGEISEAELIAEIAGRYAHA